MSMDTPICDFVRAYNSRNPLRVHMPGHKGAAFLGMESLDLTEIEGADNLYAPEGIIQESERNASQLFGCPTFYSTEGSSQCIRAMLYLTLLHAKQTGKKLLVAAGRNVHKTFLSAAALLDIEVLWIYPQDMDSYLSCNIDAAQVEAMLASAPEKPVAVYLTSPDYLGNVADVASIAEVCRKHDVLLLVDNAHGAYMRFLEPSQHPMDLGATMCCDSAHKTLPVLTGGAYLHISPAMPSLATQVKTALALFGSTSPSYLILQSLDAANHYLSEHAKRLRAFLPLVQELKMALEAHGFCLYGTEPLKITLCTKPYGYTGDAFATVLHEQNIVCEFFDPDYMVLMLTPELGAENLQRLKAALTAIPRLAPITKGAPSFQKAQRVCSMREALLSVAESVPVAESVGRVLADATVGCPPAVPILACGERIDDHAVLCFQYYGITHCMVMAQQDK